MPIPAHGLGEAINDRSAARRFACDPDRQRRSAMTRDQHHPKRPSEETLDALVRIVGEDHAIRDPAAMAPYLVEWRDRYVGKAALVLKPGSTRRSRGDPEARQRDAHGDRAARRQYRAGRRPDPVRERP